MVIRTLSLAVLIIIFLGAILLACENGNTRKQNIYGKVIKSSEKALDIQTASGKVVHIKVARSVARRCHVSSQYPDCVNACCLPNL